MTENRLICSQATLNKLYLIYPLIISTALCNTPVLWSPALHQYSQVQCLTVKVKQTKYHMAMPANVLQQTANIPLFLPHKMCICFEMEKCAHQAFDVSSTSNLCAVSHIAHRTFRYLLWVFFWILEHVLYVQLH